MSGLIISGISDLVGCAGFSVIRLLFISASRMVFLHSVLLNWMLTKTRTLVSLTILSHGCLLTIIYDIVNKKRIIATIEGSKRSLSSIEFFATTSLEKATASVTGF